MSQESAILRDLIRGRRITALSALKTYGCLRLAARIERLRSRGHQIETDMIEVERGKRIARYRLSTKKPQRVPGF